MSVAAMWFDVDQEELLRLLLRLHQRIEGQAMPELESRSCSRCLINDADDSNAVYPPNDQMQGGQRARDVRWRAVCVCWRMVKAARKLWG